MPNKKVIDEVRKKCGSWSKEEEECEEDYPEDCPYSKECETDAEGE